MTTVNVQEAKTRLSDLLARAERGEQITIARAGSPVVRLVPVTRPAGREFGGLDFEVPDDFDGPLPEEELTRWE